MADPIDVTTPPATGQASPSGGARIGRLVHEYLPRSWCS